MNTTDFIYAIGDVVKINKTLHLQPFDDKPAVIMERFRRYDTNEYKTIVCGYENRFFHFFEKDIVGKYNE
jgi:hypothetical protein